MSLKMAPLATGTGSFFCFNELAQLAAGSRLQVTYSLKYSVTPEGKAPKGSWVLADT